MNGEVLILIGAAVSVAFVHTIAGPDHYLPFVAMARAGSWRRAKTLWITALCGLGHVGSSLLLAALGVLVFRGADHFLDFEGFRGDLAAWGLIVFGLLYALWGLRRARHGHTHTHRHVHVDGHAHEHRHTHAEGHVHKHDGPGIGPWALFIVFVLGPCEPLIPMIVYASAEAGTGAAIAVAATFTLVTIATMLGIVVLILGGVERLKMPRLERFQHVLAGLVILACGVGIRFLGL